MAIPKPEPKDWLAAAADELRIGDRATLKLLQQAYRNINRILAGLPDTPDAAFGNLIYRAQLERTRRELLAEQARLFERLGDMVSARRLRSATRAAKLSAAADAALLGLVGEGEAGQRLYDGAGVTAQRTLETILARMGLSAVPLAERIYKTKVWMDGRLDRLITSTMAAGLNARRFAKVARDWFAPSVPGGTRYAAYRLARTEINNAFHATSVSYAAGKPWISQMEWNLSKSHPAPDKCDEYAAASPWNVHEVPRKPHPQCMCYVTEAEVDEDEWIDRFVAGEFDDYLDSELEKAGETTGLSKASKGKISGKIASTPLHTAEDETSVPAPAAVAGPVDVPSAPPGATGRKLPSSSPERADQPPRTDPAAFAERLSKAATGAAALQAAYFGLDRKLGSKNYHRMTDSMRSGVNQYTGSWYRDINRFLRSGEYLYPENAVEARRYQAGIDEAMAESSMAEDAVAFRGMHNARVIFGDRIDNDLTGFGWREDAYVSTTVSEKRTGLFLAGSGAPDRVLLRILVPKGTSAVEASNLSKEAELLINRGYGFRVVKDNGIGADGIRRLDIEIIPSSK